MNGINIELSQASGVPFYRQIVDQLSSLIRSGQLSPGAKLPSVRELASQLLVSLITVRRAYSDLENAQLIIRRQGHGTYVQETIQPASRDQSLSEVRAGLSQVIAHAGRLGMSPEELRAMFGELLEQKGGRDEAHSVD